MVDDVDTDAVRICESVVLFGGDIATVGLLIKKESLEIISGSVVA